VPKPTTLRRLARRASSGGDDLSAILSLANATDIITFSGGFPAPETFPIDFLQAMAEQSLRADAAVALQYTPTEGLASLRAVLGQWIADGQGRRPEPDELMVTSGGIEALQLLSRTLLDPGDRVLVENPSYVGAVTAFTGFEAQVEAIGLDEDGIRVDELATALEAGPAPAFVYVIPDFQNPTGRWLSTERRHALVELARRHGVLIIEDVAYRELAFVPEERPSLWSLGPDVVVQVGTFSKILFPGVRLGWATAEPGLISALVRAKQNSDQCAGGLGQWLAEAYLAGGHLERQLGHSRTLYAARSAALDGALRRHLPAGCEWTVPLGGFFSWLTVPAGVDTASLTDRATELGVAYVPGAPFYPDRGRTDQLRLAFSRVTEDQIEQGAARLGVLFTEALDRTGGHTIRP
jgi:2-aminoadipate transaminase